MKHFIFLLSLPIICSLFFQANAQPAGQMSISLKQAREYALEHNANMKNAVLDIAMAKKKIWETTAIGLPQVSASGTYQHLFHVPSLSLPGTALASKRDRNTTFSAAPTGAGTDSVFLNYVSEPPIKLGVADNATFNFSVSQLLFSGEYLVGLQASKVFLEISQNSLQLSTQDLKESVANSYSLVLVMQRNKEILAQSLTNLNKTLSDMREMFNQGFIENTDVDQIELTVHTLENGLKTIDNQVNASFDLLKFQMGIPFETNVELTDKLDDIVNSADVASILSNQFKVENMITYKVLENQEAIGVLQLKRQKSTYLPNLAAFYQHTEQVINPQFNFTPKDVAGVSLNIPLFSSGQRNAQYQQSVMSLEKIQNSKSMAVQGLQLDYIKSRDDLTTSFDKYQNEKRNIELTSRIYDKTLIKYKEGVSSSMDLTNAQNQYLTAQSNYFTAVYTLLTAKNKLEKLLNIQ